MPILTFGRKVMAEAEHAGRLFIYFTRRRDADFLSSALLGLTIYSWQNRPNATCLIAHDHDHLLEGTE